MRLRNLTLALLLFCFSAQSWGAQLYDGVDDYVTITDNDALTIPDSDYTVAGWVKLTGNAGSAEHIVFDNFAGGSGCWWEIIIGESSSSFGDDIRLSAQDDDGTALDATSTSNPFASNTNWTHIIVQRSGTTHTTYINNSSVASANVSAFDACNGGAVVFGRWSDAAPGAYLNGSLAEWAKWGRALSSAEMAGLANGFSPNCYPGFQWLTPMVRDYNELAKGIAVTNSGSTVIAHPRIYSCGG